MSQIASTFLSKGKLYKDKKDIQEYHRLNFKTQHGFFADFIFFLVKRE